MFFGQTLHSPTEMRQLWTAAPSGGRDSDGQGEESRLGIHPAWPGGAEAGQNLTHCASASPSVCPAASKEVALWLLTFSAPVEKSVWDRKQMCKYGCCLSWVLNASFSLLFCPNQLVIYSYFSSCTRSMFLSDTLNPKARRFFMNHLSESSKISKLVAYIYKLGLNIFHLQNCVKAKVVAPFPHFLLMWCIFLFWDSWAIWRLPWFL